MSKHVISSIEQGRAQFAYKKVNEALQEIEDDKALKEKKKEEQKKKYRAHVKDVPMMIKTNGLGATFAFIFSKKDKEKAYGIIYTQTTAWLAQERTHLIDLSNNTQLVEELVKLNSSQYRAVTIEVLALFNWLRRFAEGLILDKEEQQP